MEDLSIIPAKFEPVIIKKRLQWKKPPDGKKLTLSSIVIAECCGPYKVVIFMPYIKP